MAQDQLQTIFNALSQYFDPVLQRQWNRTTVFLGALASSPGKPTEWGGKNVAFDVEFTGATAGTVAEGSDVAASEYAQDIDLPAVLPWATYRSSFWVTEQEVDAAFGSAGTANDLMDIFGSRILSAGAIIASQLENDALVGTGVDASGNPTVIGIYGGALTASGAYAGINANTYSEWQGNVLANGGTPRTLTPDLVEQADANIFTASSLPWDLAMGSAGVVRKYVGMFTTGPTTSAGVATNQPLIRMMDGASGPQYGLGPALGGAAGVDSGQQQGLYLKGNRFLRNRLNPSGKMSLLNTNQIKMKYLPRRLRQADIDFMQIMGVQGASGLGGPSPVVQATGMPMRIAVLAKTGDSYKLSCRITTQMAITRRNSCALISDVSET